MAISPQTLSLEDRRLVAAWAADCADHVLGIFEDVAPDDARVRSAISQARGFATGDLDVDAAIRRRGGDAGAGARAVTNPAARAAAYSAEQAAAVAHMGAHALGAAGYAAKAIVLAAGGDDVVEVLRREVAWQSEAMSDAVAGALSQLPVLGENRSGPLAPGRLAGGLVGEAIRALQEGLRQRR